MESSSETNLQLDEMLSQSQQTFPRRDTQWFHYDENGYPVYDIFDFVADYEPDNIQDLINFLTYDVPFQPPDGDGYDQPLAVTGVVDDAVNEAIEWASAPIIVDIRLNEGFEESLDDVAARLLDKVAKLTVASKLECPICHELKGRNATFHCEHAVCADCLRGMLVSKMRIHNGRAQVRCVCCPLCRTQFFPPDW